VGFDLPAPSQGKLHGVLLKELDKLLTPTVTESEWESERWSNVWIAGISSFFTNIREIYRFLNSFSFFFDSFRNSGTLEVNPVDLIAIECLRVFEPEVYNELRENKALLTRIFSREMRPEVEKLGKRLLEISRCGEETAKPILSDLFPSLEMVWQNHGYSTEFYSIWTSKRRICTEGFFDRYFIFRIPSDQVSEFTIREILNTIHDRNGLAEIFSRLKQNGLLLAALERLESERSLSKLGNPLPYLLALMDLSDDLPQMRQRMLPTSGCQFVRYAILRVLKNTEDSAERLRILTSLIRDSKCIGRSAEWISDMSNPKENSWIPKLETTALSSLKDLWLTRIRDAACTGRLLSVSNLGWGLPYWRDWGNGAEVKDWIASLATNSRDILLFLSLQIKRSTRQTVGSYHVKLQAWLSWQTLEEFQPREFWEAVADRLSSQSGLSQTDQDTLKLLQAALKRWREGVADGNPRTFELEDDGL
jgi:hypothetical protein